MSVKESTSVKFCYFAADGSWGDANGLEIIDVSEWSVHDFDSIADCADDMRVILARGIQYLKETNDYDYS